MKILGSATVLQVRDITASLSFYKEILGFQEDFKFGPYASVHFGDLCIHLCAHKTWKRPLGGGAISIFCDQVDDYCAKLRELGANIRKDPFDEPYGMRDFTVSDPDGNVLTFGRSLEPDPTSA